jgi:fructan beta-fructosidase
MTVPRSLSLLKKSGYYELQSEPVVELNSIAGGIENFNGSASLEQMSARIEFNVEDSEPFTFKLSNDSSEQAVINWDGSRLTFDRRHAGLSDFSEAFAAEHQADMTGVVPQHLTIYVDQSSVEVFVNNGERVMTEIVFPRTPYNRVTLEKKSADFTRAYIPNIFQRK